jgi:hypothetical protein
LCGLMRRKCWVLRRICCFIAWMGCDVKNVLFAKVAVLVILGGVIWNQSLEGGSPLLNWRFWCHCDSVRSPSMVQEWGVILVFILLSFLVEGYMYNHTHDQQIAFPRAHQRSGCDSPTLLQQISHAHKRERPCTLLSSTFTTFLRICPLLVVQDVQVLLLLTLLLLRHRREVVV